MLSSKGRNQYKVLLVLMTSFKIKLESENFSNLSDLMFRNVPVLFNSFFKLIEMWWLHIFKGHNLISSDGFLGTCETVITFKM